MSKFSSLFTTILGVLGCSAAVALQPTVRAGSLSLNSAVKPTAGNVTSTVATQSTATPDASRGSALSKFSPAVVPVSRTNNNNNQNVNSDVLDELRQEIAELTAEQNSLRDNQLSRSDVEDTVEEAVKELNLTTTNTDLKNTISDLQSSNQSLQRSIDNLTNRTENLEDTENGAVVNILKVRGLINSNNTVPFALKTEIEPTALAQKIVTDASATATLADKIQPKDTDIRDIITDELTEVGVLKNGALDVEKKGEVQVTEATVTNALRNSSNFKQMVSDEIATKGYVTTTALNERGFVTNDALNNKNFLSTDSVAFSKLATKDEIAPAAIAASIADSESAKQVLSGKIGPDESSVKGLITGELQRLQIVDGANTLKVATTAQVDPVSIATSIADNEAAKAKLSGKIGPDESSVKGLIFDELKKRDIVDASDNLKLATASDVSVESLTDKLDDVFAGKDDVPTVDEQTVSAALANSTTLDDTIIRNLKNKRLLKDSGDLNVATNDSVSTLSSRVAVLDGGINDDGSLLNIIAKDETLKELLRGKDGTSYKLKGSVETYENLVKNNVTQISDIVEGDGYFTQDTGKLYVYNCDSNGNNCKFPAEKDGIELKGEKGDPGDPGASAETTWHSYCTTDNNLNNIIKPLYGTSKTCDNFTEEEYIALMDGSKAYCMLVAKNAKENSNYLVATKGIGKTLEDVFGSGTVSNLKNNGLSASVSINGQTEKFVFACAKKYDEIMNPKSAWYSYCSEGTNLTSIIQPLYGASTVKTCDDFTQEQYNAIMGGPKAYCLMVAKNVDSSTLNVKNNLKRLFGDTIVSTLSSQKVATKVTLNNQTISFVDACAQKYEEIMAGKSGDGYLYRGTIDNYSELSGKPCDAEHEADAYYNLEVGDALLYICACNDEKNSCSFPAKGKGVNFKGEPGENGKPASQIYCEAHAVNYPSDVTNLTLIQKLYPDRGISSCDPSVFTQDLYAAIIGGANAYCTSLNATFNTGVSLNDGVGLKLAKIYATKKSVSLSSAKDALRTLQAKDAKERMNDSNFSILDECIANYNSIMSGDDGDTAWYAYCMEQDDKGVSNLTKIITPLYSNVTSCEQFKSDMYNAIMGGAKSYCLSLVQKVDTLDLNAGIGQKLVRTFGSEKMQSLKATSTVQDRLTMTGFKANANNTNETFIAACEARYNEIMSGTSTEQQYCEDNIEIVKKLYSKITSKEDCADKFTNADYTAIMGGSTAYCLSLVQNPTVLNLTEGIGKRMSAKLGSAKMAAFVDTTTYTTPQSRMAITGFAGKSSNNADFMTACKERYDEIMAGDDGESAAYTWCKAHVVATGFRTAQTVKKMSAAKTLNAFTARGNVATYLTKSGNEGYFTSMEACLAAVEADPSLMGGETAEEAKYNSDVAAGEVAFEISTTGKTAFNQRKANFVNSIKGAPGANGINGINGVDGKTFRPSFDANGNIVFTQSNDTSSASLNFVDGIRGALSGGDSTKAAYGTASLEDAIAAIAAKVAFNVSKEVSKEVSSEMSKQVSEAVSRDISSKISDRVTKRIINNADIITGTRLVDASVSDGVINTCGGISGGKGGDLNNNGMCQTTANLFSNVPEASTDSNVTADISMSNIRNNVNTALASNTTLNNMNIYSVAGITKNTSVSCSTSQYLNNGICMSCGTGATSTGGSATSCSCSNGFTWTTSGCTCSGDNKYIDNGQCKALPSNATRTTNGFICNAGYYKNSAGTACNSCGTNATSNAGSTSCSCNDASYTWSATSTSGQCTVDYTQLAADCKANSGKYWSNNTCNDVPANATQSGNGTSFSCNANYYKSGNSCLTCGNGATSNAGATTCTCTASGYEWSTTSNGGTCTQTCAQTINNICVNGESDCNKISGYEWNGGKCVKTTTTCEKPSVYVGEKFGTCKTCGEFGLPYIAELGSCCTENTYLFLGEESPTCRSCPSDTTYDKKTATCVCKDGKTSFDASTGKCK